MLAYKHTARSILSLLCAAMVLAGCKPSAEATVKSYMDAHLQGKDEKAYEYLSSSDKKIKNLQEFTRGNDDTAAMALRQKTTYQILHVEENKDTAVATIKITMPDPASLIKDVMGMAFKSVTQDGAKPDINKELTALISAPDVPLKTEEQKIKLVREDSGWKINLEWEKEKKIAQLLQEAKAHKANKELPAALDKLNKVLELDSQMVEAQKASEETKKDIDSFHEKQAYISNIELYDLSSKYYSTYLESKIPGVNFKLKNKGDRVLKKVEVTIYFKDKDGNVISEETYHPVLVTEYSFTGDNKPLKPSYIWQMERGKFYQAKSVPSEWKEGAVSAKISDIAFAE